MSTIISESSIFTVKKSDYTPEQWERMQKRNESEERAEAQLSQLYGERVATMILLTLWPLIRILLRGLQIPMRRLVMARYSCC